ncbi:MAG TPA: TonB-dependent receptor [Terriglobia bacterium]|nr:TonB-dependent receptor [Terriglobia bacterium]
MHKFFRIIALCLGLLLIPKWVYAQGQMGAVTGTIFDASGAVVPETEITITNTDSGLRSVAKGSSAGYYRVPVPPGTYQVEARKEGFKASVAQNIVVSVAQIVTIDMTLQVGVATQSVTVTTEAPLLTSSTAEVSSSVTPEEFQALPIEVGDGGRNPQTFIFTSLPGTVGGTWSGSINGGQLFSHEILIDGVTIGRYDLAGGSMDEYSPGTDAIGEFKVQMSNYSAEYGDTGGGIANFSMKSGTNQFHGTTFEYNKNPVFNAAGLVANASGGQKDNEKENNFGGTLGGRIRRDKTFFFASYEGDRYRSFAPAGKTTIPTPAMRGGDFSSWLGANIGPDALGRPVYKNEIYDPTTTRLVPAGAADPVTGLVNTTGNDATIRDPFMSGGQLNVIPPGEFSKATSVIAALFPNPLLSGNNLNTLSFSGCCPELRRDAFSTKIDEVIGDKQKISGVFGYYVRDRYNRNGTTFPPFPGQPINPYKQQKVGGPQVRLQDTWTVNEHSVNILSLGYNRFQNANNVTDDAKFTSQMGIPGVPDTCLPSMSFSNSNTGVKFISRIGVGCHNTDPSESYDYQDTYTNTRGRHSLKFGGQFLRYRYNTYEPANLSGAFQFNSITTDLPGFTKSTGHPFATFLMGAANSASKSVYATEPGYRAGLFAFFAQDDWRATSKLTLNIGIRWEIPLPKKEAYDRQSGFDPTLPNPGADNIPGALEFLGSCSTCVHRSSFQNWYFKEVAPRLGVAYAPTKNLVLRGGYGISYGPPILNNFGSQNLYGYNSGIALHHASGAVNAVNPVTYLSSLASAALPANANVGLPPFNPVLPDTDPAQANGNSLDFLPVNSLAQPYVQNWSAGFQYQLPHQIMVEANYLGSKGTRLLDSYFANYFNQPNSKFMALGDNLNDDLALDLADPVMGPVLASYGVTQLPYPDFENSNNCGATLANALAPNAEFCGLTNNYPTMGSSTYHSLQVMAKKNAAHGLTFIAAYTISKALTDTDTALYYPSDSVVQDFYNRKEAKSLASFDYPQNLKLTWIYALPFGHGRRWLTSAGKADRLFSGWQITAIQNYNSGDPLTIHSALSPVFTPGLLADIVPGVPQRVTPQGLNYNLAYDPNSGAVTNGTAMLNPNAFVDPPSSPNNGYPLRVGTAPRFLPNVRGPGQESESFGIIKDTKINERVTFQVRGDMFNVLNRTGRGDPDTYLGDGLPSQGGTFGLITGPYNGPRVVQFAMRLNF